MINHAELAKAKAKIDKLLNMTVENGCSEDEQETAMSMAAGIAARLGIEAYIEQAKQKVGGVTEAVRKAVKKAFNQEFKVHQVLAFEAAAKLYGCKLYTYSHGKGGLFFVGREENCELAEQTAFWLMRQVELLYKQNLPRGLSQSVRAEFRRTFKAACALRVRDRAIALMYEMRRNDAKAQEATGQNALVVQGYFDQLDRENADFFKPTPEQEERWKQLADDHRKREEARRNAMTQEERDAEDKELERARKKEARAAARRKGPRARTIPTGNGTRSGLAAGDQVQLRREVR